MLTEKSIQRLSSQLAAELGFSIFSQDLAALALEHGSDVDHFIQSIFGSEGMDPNLVDRNLYRQVAGMVRTELSASQQEQLIAGT